MAIRVVLADDHELFRWGFELAIKKQPDIQLVGEARNGKELVEKVEELLPDIVVTDINMPVLNGIEATRIITRRFPKINVIGLTMFDKEDIIIDMLEAGGKGYLMKHAHPSEIVEGIRHVSQQETYYCKHTSSKLLQIIGRSKFNPYQNNPVAEFNEKEMHIIHLVCNGLSNKEIAAELKVSIRTAEAFRGKILEKMQVKNTAGLIIYAIKNNLYKVDPDML